MTAPSRAPSDVEAEILRRLVGGAPDGIAILDSGRRCRYVNSAGSRMLGIPPDALYGELVPVPGEGRLDWAEWPMVVDHEPWVAVVFREPDSRDRHQQQLAAFARTAARVALVGPVEEVLDRVAEEARAATGARACSIILRDGEGFDAHLVGIAGHEAGYLPRLLAALERGAPLATLEAFRSGRPGRRSHLQQLIKVVPEYGSLVDSAETAGWTDIVAVPMVVQEQTLGVLTTFFGEEQSPSGEDVAFLVAMADQCGVAVHNSRLFAEVQAAAAAEQRHRWAHDLHDSVSQSLFSLVLQTRALRLAARRAEPAGAGQVADGPERLEILAEGMQSEMRALMTELRPGVGGEPLGAAVSRLTREIQEQTGLLVALDMPATEPEVSDFVGSEVYRVVREAVHNAVQHAGATRLSVSVTTGTGGGLTVDVVDDGHGFDAQRPNPGHLGLWSMRERAERLGGTCTVSSSPAGSRVHITVPGRRGGPGGPSQ